MRSSIPATGRASRPGLARARLAGGPGGVRGNVSPAQSGPGLQESGAALRESGLRERDPAAFPAAHLRAVGRGLLLRSRPGPRAHPLPGHRPHPAGGVGQPRRLRSPAPAPAARGYRRFILHGEDDPIPIEAARNGGRSDRREFHVTPSLRPRARMSRHSRVCAGCWSGFLPAGMGLVGPPARSPCSPLSFHHAQWPAPPRSISSSPAAADEIFPSIRSRARAAGARSRRPGRVPDGPRGRDAAPRPPAARRTGRGHGPAGGAGAPRLPALGRGRAHTVRSPPSGSPHCSSRPGRLAVGRPGRAPRATTPSCRTGRSGPRWWTASPPSRWTAASSTSREADLRVLGIFGLRPERAGFSAVEVSGAAAGRAGSTPTAAPCSRRCSPAGRRAGLYSIAGGEELLELGWRTRALAQLAAAPLPTPS